MNQFSLNGFIFAIATCSLLASFSFAEVGKLDSAAKNEVTTEQKDELPPYLGVPPTITLNAEQLEQLKRGEPVYPPAVEAGSEGGGAVAVFRVNAPAKIIWNAIGNFDQYKNWVNGVQEAKPYKAADKDNIYIQFTVGKLGFNYVYHVIHNYPMQKTGWGTWTLDTSMSNDFKACRGFWRVTPVAGNPDQSDVEYSVDLRASGIMMRIFRSMLLQSGVRDATSWVKKQSELLFEASKLEVKPNPVIADALKPNPTSP